MRQKWLIAFCLTLGLLLPWQILAASTYEQTASGDLIIHGRAITEKPTFIPLTVDGQKMEIIAVKDQHGLVRLAFNTCKVCNGSPKAYFKFERGGFVCQNCDNFFPVAEVGASRDGCNPLGIPSFELDAHKDIHIMAHVLRANKNAFRNWKRGIE